MPARATLVYIVKQNAKKTGLSFAMPSWWDVDYLFEKNANRRIVLPEGRELLLLEWTSILDFKQGKKVWDLPKLNAKKEPKLQESLLEAVQKARWFVVERKQVWIVPENTQPGCEVRKEPPWWHFGFFEKEFKAWYQEFRKKHLTKRYFEIPNPFWMDYVSLLTGEEAQVLDKRAREGYRVWKKKLGEKITDDERREMAHLARSLKKAAWVVLYDYEWESGLA